MQYSCPFEGTRHQKRDTYRVAAVFAVGSPRSQQYNPTIEAVPCRKLLHKSSETETSSYPISYIQSKRVAGRAVQFTINMTF